MVEEKMARANVNEKTHPSTESRQTHTQHTPTHTHTGNGAVIPKSLCAYGKPHLSIALSF